MSYIIKSGICPKYPRHPSEKVKKTTVERIYGKGKHSITK